MTHYTLAVAAAYLLAGLGGPNATAQDKPLKKSARECPATA